jgi:membrane protease YdiL (CAAX protease family)
VTSVPPPSRPGPPAPLVRPELPDGLPPERVPRDPVEPPRGQGRWLPLPLWAPFAAMLGAVIAIVLVGAIVTTIWLLTDPGADTSSTPDGLLIALTLVQDALLVGAAVYVVAAMLKRATPAMFGIRTLPLRIALKWIVAAYAAYWIFNVLLLSIFGQPPEQDLVRDLKETQDVAVLIGFGVLTCLVAPLAEELFFRGFMFSVLAARLGVWWGAAITGVIFGLIHLPGAPALGVAVLVVFGAALCFVYYKSGSLIPCMALHAFNNAVSFGFTKSLPGWGVLLLIVGSVASVVLIAVAVARRGAPATAPA